MKKSQKGFTIIEVALVLAIGALIFLVVFLAVPALQRNQRNDARKRDISSVVDAVASYTGNNPGKIVGTADSVYDSTIGKGKSDTDLGKYLDTLSTNTDTVTVKTINAQPTKPATFGDSTRPNTIYVVTGAKCQGSDNIVKASTRSVAVIGAMETASGIQAYCQDAN